ncbi:MAG TPA: LytTR family transcriptional regulator DNA-binding domain-containing protein [Paenibacillaceae bacterium]
MIYPVTRDRNNETEIIMLDLSEVTYMVNEDGVIAFYTETDKFYPLVPSLSLYEKHLHDMGFYRLDRVNLVNMNKVKGFDEQRGLVFFDDPPHQVQNSTTVAFMKIRKMKHTIMDWIRKNQSSRNTGKEGKQAPEP